MATTTTAPTTTTTPPPLAAFLNGFSDPAEARRGETLFGDVDGFVPGSLLVRGSLRISK